MSFIKFFIGLAAMAGIAKRANSSSSGSAGIQSESKSKIKTTNRTPKVKAKSKPKAKAKAKSKVNKLPPRKNSVPKIKSITKPAKKVNEAKVEENKEYPNSFFINIPENADQFSNVDDESPPIDVYIGLDFGTSSVKTIVQLPLSTEKPAFVVSFGNFADPSLEYLLPTRVFIDPQTGVCSLKSEDSRHIELTTIKVGLMEDPDEPMQSVNGLDCNTPVKYIATAYIALVLRYVRCWFLTEAEKFYKNKRIRWSLNLGIPVAKDDDDKIRHYFEITGKAAWITSLEAGPIKISNAEKNIKAVENKNMEDNSLLNNFGAFNLIPEVIAEVHGYSKTKYRRDGFHVLVDVGATTLDISGFTLSKNKDEEENEYRFYCADVANWGSIPLHKERIEAIKSFRCPPQLQKKLLKNLEESGIYENMQMVPSEPNAYLPSDIPGRYNFLDKLKKIDNDFIRGKAFSGYLGEMLRILNSDRSPHSIPWTQVKELGMTLPVILCGGASAMPAYQNLIQKYTRNWLKRCVAPDFDILLIQITKPENILSDISDEVFHRLAVAWGLSHSQFHLGNYLRPSEIELKRKPRRKKDENFVDSSQV